MNKFRNKLPKEDLKKFAKEIGKKLVASDFKNNRVEDPTKITPKHEKKVRKYVKDFFDRAVIKKGEHERKRAERKSHSKANGHREEAGVTDQATSTSVEVDLLVDAKAEDSDDEGMSDIEGEPTPQLATPGEDGLKRKRDADMTPDDTLYKRIKDESSETLIEPSPPPPPPPPPQEDLMKKELMEEQMDEEEAELRAQEEALMRENEEALKDAVAHNEYPSTAIQGSIDEVDEKIIGVKKEESDENTAEEINGDGASPMKLDPDKRLDTEDVLESNGVDENMDTIHHERAQVLSH
jgi:histone-lysine N-methyltransferase SETD2